jgi:hypothetical protein
MDPDSRGLEKPVEWASCSWDGARESRLRTFRLLPFREKLQAIEDWCEVTRSIRERRHERGQPNVPLHTDDPATRQAGSKQRER